MEIVRNRRWVVVVAAAVVAAAVMMTPVNSDINKDKEECAGALAGLATCLAYVGGKSKAPTPDCCTGLKQVVRDNMKCLCILIKDRDDPSLGLHINLTLALTLPQTCHGYANVSQCPDLLHLGPNDPDAKLFTDFAKASASTNTTAPASSVAGSGSSSGGGSLNVKSDSGNENKSLVNTITIFTTVVVLFSSFTRLSF